MKKIRILLYAMILMWQLVFLSGCGEKEVVFSSAMEEDKEITSQSEVTDKKEEASKTEEIKADTNLETTELAETKENTEQYYIHIFGEVVTPGVYCVSPGTRIYQVVEIAGGFTREADENYVNLADLVTDGQKIQIYSLEEAKENLENGIVGDTGDTKGTEAATEQMTAKVNINTASESELCTLPGVGAGKAKSIITYREENGGFGSVEEIMQVAGIKEGTYNGLKDMITVEK